MSSPRRMEMLIPGRFADPVTAYGYTRTVFDQVASGLRPPTISITPSNRHVGVTRRDTHRRGFGDAVRAAEEEGYPVLVRSSGGGATAAGEGTFGFSIVRPSDAGESRRGIQERYREAADYVLAAFSRLGVQAEVGEARGEFCPGDHSIRFGGWRHGIKLVGIAQRVTRRATSVGGIVIVYGERELARVLERVYGAMSLPFRAESVGSLRRTGYAGTFEAVIEAFAAEAELRYAPLRVFLDNRTLERAREAGSAQRAVP